MGKLDLFSNTFQTVNVTACNPAILSTIAELQAAHQFEIHSLFSYKEYIAVSFLVKVNLPSRGTADGIDIRNQEPLLLFFHKTEYPGKAPQIRADRRDFPAEDLPHLNPVFPGEPFHLCLHRGSINDWYAEHSIQELVERAIKWLEDAAMGHLIKERDRFEPTRIDMNHWVGGVSVFSHRLFSDFIEDAWNKNSKSGVAYVSSYCSLTSDNFEWFRLLSDTVAPSVNDVFTRHDREQQNRQNPFKGELIPGVLLWPDKANICKRYFGCLPGTINELFDFADGLGLNLRQVFTGFRDKNQTHTKALCPIFLCVQRPLRLIGFESNLEILSFTYIQDEKDKVYMMLPREPITTSFAQMLSNQEQNTTARIFLLGCGALGSKIGLHLGRAGITDLTLVDDDTLSPHNLVRHALLARSVGVNKARGLEVEIRAIYADSGQPIDIVSLPENFFSTINNTTFKGVKYIIDATASVSVFERLQSHPNPHQTPVVRCEIADEGRLGIMLIEGCGRSPNIGDMRVNLYDMALDTPMIENWLKGFQSNGNEEFEAGLEDITIGIGCSSPTMRLSDDVISFHASTQAISIRKMLSSQKHSAGILISSINSDEYPLFATSFFPVEKFRTLQTKQSNGWNIRAKSSLCDLIIQKAVHSSPIETGGILIGHIDTKHKVIYVTRQIDPPSDSDSWPYAFKMGVNGIPEQIQAISKKSGNLITYVGEWHSHPNTDKLGAGSSSPSIKDRETAKELKVRFDKIGQPTFIMIVTQQGCYPYIF